jgi:glycosyltransferase involved in cell wall biosynthesis
LEGALSQHVNFDCQIVIGEDGSTDGTPAVLSQYQKKYPNKLALILHDPSRGAMFNLADRAGPQTPAHFGATPVTAPGMAPRSLPTIHQGNGA